MSPERLNGWDDIVFLPLLVAQFHVYPNGANDNFHGIAALYGSGAAIV
jgi:hypothetical protein